MKNFFKNKVFISAILFFAMIISLFSSVFAVEYTDVYNNTTVDFPDFSNLMKDNYNVYIIAVYKDWKTILYVGNVDLSVFPYLTEGRGYLRFAESTSKGLKMYELSNNQWDYMNGVNNDVTYSQDNIYFTNTSVYTDSSRENLLFPLAPLVEPTILAPIVEQAETEKITAEIIGLLPLIVTLLVSILAIYKAIKFLRNVLKIS